MYIYIFLMKICCHTVNLFCGLKDHGGRFQNNELFDLLLQLLYTDHLTFERQTRKV